MVEPTERYKQKKKAGKSSTLSRLTPSSIGKGARSLGQGVAQLISAEDTDPDPRGYSRSGTDFYSASVDINRPDPDTEDYWTEYKNNPIISSQIQNLADEVFEAGWWVTADSDKTQDEITEFCQNIGIKAGQPHQSFSKLGKMAVIQHQVRGTFLGERVTDENGRDIAINPMNPTTIEIYTKPGVNMLVPPDYDGKDDDADLKKTPDGKSASYVQFDSDVVRWEDRDERLFARDQMVHWARKPDIGDVRGNSCVEPIYDRSKALRDKLQDNDLAISMKAWPMILFQLGSPEYPWTKGEQEDFMSDYSQRSLGPGMFQGVPGDVDVHEFAGETADIENHVMTDVDLIISGLPGPKYALGSFVEGLEGDQEAHERQFKKVVRSIRRDLESLFTPYLKDVAESWGYDTDELEIHIGRPDGEVAPEDIQGSIIRYQSDVDSEAPQPVGEGPAVNGRGEEGRNPDDTNGGNGGAGGGSGNEQAGQDKSAELSVDEQSDSPPRDQNESRSPGWEIEDLAQPSFEPRSVATLTSHNAVSPYETEDDLGKRIGDLLTKARDETIDYIESQYNKEHPPSGKDVAEQFETRVATIIRSERFSSVVSDACEDIVDKTIETLNSKAHQPQVAVSPRAEHSELSSTSTQYIISDILDLANQMSVELRRSTDDISHSERDLSAIGGRIRDTYDYGTLDHRGRLIARMRGQELVNRTKLSEYHLQDEIVGVKITSSCDENVHRVTADLAGCESGNYAVSLFDDDRSIGGQFQAQLSVDPPQGFDPLPDVPPFHFGDRSEIAPLVEDDINE